MQLLVCCSSAMGFGVRASDWHSGLGLESKNFFCGLDFSLSTTNCQVIVYVCMDVHTRMPLRVAKSSSSGTELMRETPIPCSRISESCGRYNRIQ